MFAFYLTQLALDVGFGTTWWLIKNTTSLMIDGTLYLIRGSKVNELEVLKNEIKFLKNEVNTLKNN